MSNVLHNQIAYYQARANEYDEWFYRKGHYDWGEEFNVRWADEAQQVRDQLLNHDEVPHILEMACGTGIWTQELIKIGEQVTALDASSEMIAINQAKVQSDRVTYQQADLFEWQPNQQFDMVFFGFWLSHIPNDKLSGFLKSVHQALKPNGRLFFIDSRKVQSSTSSRQTVQTKDNIQTRVLNDGRQFEIIKIYYDATQLTQTLIQHDFDINVQTTPTYFIYADGRKAN